MNKNSLDSETSPVEFDVRNRRAILSRFSSCDDLDTLKVVANFLGNASPVVCEAAAKALIRCANPQAAQVASPHLFSSELSERSFALMVLSNLGENALIELSSLLQDDDPDIRKFVCEALMNIPGQASNDLLCSALQDSAPSVAAAAAEALGQHRQPSASGPLMEAFQNSSSRVRIAILSALGNIGGSQALAVISQNAHKMTDAELCVAIQATGCAGESDPDLAWSFLLDCFGSANPAVQNAVLTTTSTLFGRGLSMPQDCMQFVAKMVDDRIMDSNPGIRLAAAQVLSASINPEAVEGLRLLSNDPDQRVKNMSLKGLILNRVFSLPELVNIAKNHTGSDEVRLLALRATALAHDPSSLLPSRISQNLERIVKEAGHEQITAAAICALLCLAPEKGIPLILACFKQGSEPQMENLVHELAGIQPRELTLLMIEGYDDRQLRLALFQIFHEEKKGVYLGNSIYGRALLTASMGDEDWMIRAYTISILTNIRMAWANNLIRHACFDLDTRVRFRALDTVLKAKNEEIDPKWLDVYRQDESVHIRNLVKSYSEQMNQPA